MTGVILCGGQSTRMGSDKGLMYHQSLSWAELAKNKLEELNLPVVLSVNEQQLHCYKEKFDSFTIVKDDKLLNVYGPLKGILSVHLEFSLEDLLVLACDMLSMQTQVLQYLIDTSVVGNEDAFVFQTNESIEPLCGIYTSQGLTKIYQLYNQGQLKKHSLHYVLENIQTCYLPVKQKWENCFNNYNSPADLGVL